MTVNNPPTITSFTPTSGVVGALVTLTGTNFTGATAVNFNGVAARSFTIKSATSITAIALTGVTTGKITVSAPSGTATSSSSFTVVLPPTQPVITAPSMVTAGQTGYTASIPAQTGCTYAWTIDGGKITAGATTTQITFTPNVLGSMKAARQNHTATLLNTGKVLLTGGTNNSAGILASAELYDPSTGTFTTVNKTMTVARSNHTATLLPSGKVLLAGGYDSSSNILASAEIYDPTANPFTATTGFMTASMACHTATLLTNGKVLLAGGIDSSGNAIASAELYDPSTGTFTAVASPMTVARSYQTATRLSSGKVLLAGGYDSSRNILASADLYDPAVGTFAAVAIPMNVARRSFTATLLPSGKVLLAGGYNTGGAPISSAEIFDPSTGTCSASPGAMTTERGDHTATLLPNGQVLMAGGNGNGNLAASGELYDPATGRFMIATGAMSLARPSHTATLLPNATILLLGGMDDHGDSLASAESYESGAAAFGCTLTLASIVTNGPGVASTPGTKRLTVLPALIQPVISVPSSAVTGYTGLSASIPAQVGCTYTWSITNGTFTDGSGTIGVTFTAGTAGTNLVLTCVVTNAAGSSKTATATVTVVPSFVTLTPASINLAPGGQQSFTANQPVYWSRSQGTLSSTTSTSVTYAAASGGANLGVGTYTLTATSRADSSLKATALITVYVSGSPLISSFSATPATIHDGLSATLNWNVSNATSLDLDAVGDVTGQTSAAVNPQGDTVYNLTASNDLGSVYAQVLVHVDIPIFSVGSSGRTNAVHCASGFHSAHKLDLVHHGRFNRWQYQLEWTLYRACGPRCLLHPGDK